MTGTHAHGRAYTGHPAGTCTWRHAHEDVVLTCDSPDIVGTGLCLTHLATADVVVFEARVITTPDGVTAAPTTGATP